jgi:hypothetical protein
VFNVLLAATVLTLGASVVYSDNNGEADTSTTGDRGGKVADQADSESQARLKIMSQATLMGQARPKTIEGYMKRSAAGLC